MSETKNAKREETGNRQAGFLKRIGIYAAVLLGVFLLGLVPMWLTARERAAERDMARASLRLSQMENQLAGAAIHAHRGEHEPARIAASDFFTTLRDEIDREESGSLNQQRREELGLLLLRRDDLITLLARNDPAAADRLSDLYVVYRKALDPAS